MLYSTYGKGFAEEDRHRRRKREEEGAFNEKYIATLRAVGDGQYIAIYTYRIYYRRFHLAATSTTFGYASTSPLNSLLILSHLLYVFRFYTTMTFLSPCLSNSCSMNCSVVCRQKRRSELPREATQVRFESTRPSDKERQCRQRLSCPEKIPKGQWPALSSLRNALSGIPPSVSVRSIFTNDCSNRPRHTNRCPKLSLTTLD